MRKLIAGVASVLALGGGIGPSAALAVVVHRSVVADNALADRITIQNVRTEGSMIVGELVNRTNRTVSDIRLLVAESFRWTDEFHPGDDDPSRATPFTVPGPIEPNGQLTVQAVMPPRPHRTDGSFEPRIEIVSLVEYESAPADQGGSAHDLTDYR